MKVVFRSSSLLLTLIGIIGHAKLARVGGVLRRGVVGRLRIGMQAGEVLERVPRGWIAHEETQAVLVYPAKGSENPALIGDITNGSISQFQVLSDSFHTDVGIGVGSPLSDLDRFYEVSWREPGYAYVELLHMRFEIRDNQVAAVLVS